MGVLRFRCDQCGEVFPNAALGGAGAAKPCPLCAGSLYAFFKSSLITPAWIKDECPPPVAPSLKIACKSCGQRLSVDDPAILRANPLCPACGSPVMTPPSTASALLPSAPGKRRVPWSAWVALGLFPLATPTVAVGMILGIVILGPATIFLMFHAQKKILRYPEKYRGHMMLRVMMYVLVVAISMFALGFFARLLALRH